MQDHMRFQVNEKGQIYLEKLIPGFIPMGGNAWKEHFTFSEEKIFYLKRSDWHSLIRAVNFLKKYCRAGFDEAFFRDHFGMTAEQLEKIEEEAKCVNIKVAGNRVYYVFKPGYEKYATADELTSFKKWRYLQKYMVGGHLAERPVVVMPVFPAARQQAATLINDLIENDTVYSTSVGFSTLFFNYLRSKGFVFTLPEVRAETVHISLKSVTSHESRDYQTEAVNAWSEKGVGVVVSASASGKTYMGVRAIAIKGVRTLILVHEKGLITQWKTNLLQFLDLQEGDIGTYTAEKKDTHNKKVIIATFQTLRKNPEFFKNLKIGLVISDECHHVPANTFREVNNYLDCPYKLGLTATPNRPDKKDGGIYEFYDQIVYDVQTSDLLDKMYVSPVLFYTLYVNDHKLSSEIKRMKKEGYEIPKFMSRLKEMSSKSPVKMKALRTLINTLNEKKLSYIIFADRIEAAETISRELEIQYLSNDSGIEKRDELFHKLREKEIPGIVTAQLAGEGVNIPSLDVVIDLIPSASNRIILQKIGRLRRRADDKGAGFYIQVVLEDVDLETRWANEAFMYFFKDTGSGIFAKRRVVYSPKDINFGEKRSAKATEQSRRQRINTGGKTDDELLEFLKDNPGTYLYEISRKLNWSRGKVAGALDRLDKKGLISKNEYLKTRETLKIKVNGNVTVFFDGACTRNPGGITSYGFVIYDERRRIHRESVIVGTEDDLTNNYAEYAGLCAAMGWLLDHGITSNITIKGDSQLAIDQMNFQREAKQGRYIPLYKKAYSLQFKFEKMPKFVWISEEENAEAHALSRCLYEIVKKREKIEA